MKRTWGSSCPCRLLDASIGSLTANERAWIEFLRLASQDKDPAPTLVTVQALQRMFRV